MLNRMSLTLSMMLVAVSPLCASAREASPAARAHRFAHGPAMSAISDREQDGLSGPVRRVKTETAKITTKNGKPVEGPRVLLETATYDIKGKKIDNAYFLAAAGGTLTGKEVYKYDDKGNIVEMTMHGVDGLLLSKEIYSYEFDSFGNWTKMMTSIAVIENGKTSFEPTEVTYRTLSYFLEEATLAKVSQPAASSSMAPRPAAAVNKASAAPPGVEKLAEKAGDKGIDGEGSKTAAAPPVVPVAKTHVASPSFAASADAGASNTDPTVTSEGEAPAGPVGRGPVKPISGGILNGKAISLPAPAYPEVAKRARTAGTVTVEVVIDLTGRVISAKALGGPVMLQSAAEKAAMQARFSPTLLSGQPVRVSGQITYNFTIK